MIVRGFSSRGISEAVQNVQDIYEKIENPFRGEQDNCPPDNFDLGQLPPENWPPPVQFPPRKIAPRELHEDSFLIG